MKKHFPWVFVIAWMAVIYYLSYQTASASNQLSKGVTLQIAELIETIFPNKEIEINEFNSSVRKLAHF